MENWVYDLYFAYHKV